MTQTPALKVKLEQAIRNSQLSSQTATNNNLKMKSNQQNLPAKPTITLKTDFTNFS